MTIIELHIQFDLQPKNKTDILEDVARKCNKGYLFVDSNTGQCYLFDKDGNEVDIKKLKKIHNEQFYESDISSVIIPNSVKSIEDLAFYGCTNLTSIIIPNSVKSIGYSVFEYCESLKSVIIPNSIKSIENWAFKYCENLESIVIPNSVESIGTDAFWCCRSLKLVEIPDSVQNIEYKAFYECENLKSLSFKGKTMKQVKEMDYYPWGIKDESIIKYI